MFDNKISLSYVMALMSLTDSDGDGLHDKAEEFLGRDPQKKDYQSGGLDMVRPLCEFNCIGLIKNHLRLT